MIQIAEPANAYHMPALFQLGFRPFFLFGSLLAIIAIIFWVSLLTGFIQFMPYGGSLWWHGHEMVFGFGVAIIAGFLLTAVQNWTGTPGVSGWHLFTLFGVWLVARILLFIGYDSMLSVVIDLAFLPMVGVYLAIPILKTKQYRNLVFVPILLLLTTANIMTHINVFYPGFSGFQQGSYGAIMTIMLLMMVMGGRVIPFFTSNSTGINKAAPIAWLDYSALGSGLLICMVFLTGLASLSGSNPYMAFLFFICGVLHLIRWSRWRFWTTFKMPLLWSLHLSYLLIPIACLLFSLHFSTGYVSIQAALHVLNIGAMSLMILAMISRVSLGHTGRALVAHWLMSLAYLSILCATVIRFVGSVFLHDYISEALLIAGAFWVLGFGLFFLLYFNILISKRVDGKMG